MSKLYKELVNNYIMIFYIDSPCYIDKSVELRTAVKRILWGKLINCGQTCIAPDYILCSKEMQEKFIVEVKSVLKEWYGDNVQSSPDLSRIINQNNFQ